MMGLKMGGIRMGIRDILKGKVLDDGNLFAKRLCDTDEEIVNMAQRTLGTRREK